MPNAPPSRKTSANCSTTTLWARFLPRTGWPMSPSFRFCSSLTDSALRLQPGALVQEALLAQGVSLRHAGYHSYGLPGLAGQTHQPRGPERLGAAPRLSLSGTVPSRTEEDRKTPASMNSLNLQVTPPRPFSIFKGSASKNRKFTHY